MPRRRAGRWSTGTAAISRLALFMFTTWGEVQDYAAPGSDGSDLKIFVGLIDGHGPDAVIDIVDRLVVEARRPSPRRKAKGREWGTVRIATDFGEPKSREGEDPETPRADGMLAYVAVTRARYGLDSDGLSWIGQWLTPKAQQAPLASALPVPATAPAGMPPVRSLPDPRGPG